VGELELADDHVELSAVAAVKVSSTITDDTALVASLPEILRDPDWEIEGCEEDAALKLAEDDASYTLNELEIAMMLETVATLPELIS
jgi:hypothetical protein